MPRGDRTGPAEMGPMTGRAAGYCAGYSMPGYANPGPRAGLGFGRGAGRGWRNIYYATYPSPQAMTKQQEVDVLKSQADYFGNALAEIKKRLEELESEAKK